MNLSRKEGKRIHYAILLRKCCNKAESAMALFLLKERHPELLNQAWETILHLSHGKIHINLGLGTIKRKIDKMLGL